MAEWCERTEGGTPASHPSAWSAPSVQSARVFRARECSERAECLERASVRSRECSVAQVLERASVRSRKCSVAQVLERASVRSRECSVAQVLERASVRSRQCWSSHGVRTQASAHDNDGATGGQLCPDGLGDGHAHDEALGGAKIDEVDALEPPENVRQGLSIPAARKATRGGRPGDRGEMRLRHHRARAE